jgi:cyclophilin family peptidyl-prolyl cis-trans isomerase
MSPVRSLLLLVSALLAMAGRAQSTVPALAQSFPDRSLAMGAAPVAIEMGSHFSLPGVAGQLVQFDTVLGRFNVELFAHLAPQHAANFINYVQAGAYSSSIFHRSAAFESNGLTSIVQGGGYNLVGTSINAVPKFNPIPLEYNLANARGTLAAARTDNINSATSEWFLNTRNNSTILGPANGGGYSVFGRVLGTGMTVVDAFASLPRTSLGEPLTAVPVRNYSGGVVQPANLAVINSISLISLFPTGAGTSLLTLTGVNTAPAVVNAVVSNSTLTLTPLAGGAATITLRATDTNGNFAQGSFLATVPITAAQGGTAVFVAPDGASTHQWQHNGVDVPGATTATLTVADVQPARAGLYAAKLTSSGTTTTGPSVILGVSTVQKVIGAGSEFQADIVHPNLNTFDQLLLGGASATFTADAGQITRLSFIDLTDDIVQIEFSGAGSVSLTLDSSSGPAAPLRYNQPAVAYMKGHVGIVVTGADATTNLSVFTVGRATAFDPTGAYNILIAPGATNVPANNGSSLFVGHAGTAYDGHAGIAYIAIASTDGQFGGLRAANVNFFATRGLTGVYAPNVSFSGPVYVGDITATDDATPVLLIGSGGDVRVTGGDLLQTNGRALQVGGISQLKFTDGSSSHGTIITARNNQGVLEQNGVNVTSQIVVNP